MNELQKRIKSFGYALQGIKSFIKVEHNAWIHCFAMTCVIIAGCCFGITATEWICVVLCFGMVLTAEAFNTAIERLANVVSPDFHKGIGDVKDVAAGAVLITAIAAAVVGLIIFIPYILNHCSI